MPLPNCLLTKFIYKAIVDCKYRTVALERVSLNAKSKPDAYKDLPYRVLLTVFFYGAIVGLISRGKVLDIGSCTRRSAVGQRCVSYLNQVSFTRPNRQQIGCYIMMRKNRF